MQNGHIKNIVFDLGNVLNKCDSEYAIQELAASSSQNADSIRRWLAESDIIDRFDSGALSEEGFQRELEKNIGWRGAVNQLHKIWDDMLSADAEMLELMRQLQRTGFRIYILSNINPFHVRLTNSSLSFVLEANGYLFSCECGMIKPDAAIFHHLLQKFHLTPSETVFIDDREINIQTARGLVIKSILHSSFDNTRKELESIIREKC